MSPGANKIRGSEEVGDYCGCSVANVREACTLFHFSAVSPINVIITTNVIKNDHKCNANHKYVILKAHAIFISVTVFLATLSVTQAKKQ